MIIARVYFSPKKFLSGGERFILVGYLLAFHASNSEYLHFVSSTFLSADTTVFKTESHCIPDWLPINYLCSSG